MSSSWDFIHRWYMPFLWLALSGLISLGMAVYFQLGMTMHPGGELGLAYGSDWVLRDDYLETIVVYGLGLGSAVWLLDFDGTTRWAALWATVAAIVRIAVPIWLVTSTDVTLANGQHYLDWHTLRIVIWFADFQMLAAGIGLWYAFRHFAGSGVSYGASHAEAYS